MRVSENQFSAMMTQAMMNSNLAINRVAEQIATGNKINYLSDDPAASVKLEGLQKIIASAEQSQKNINNVQSKYDLYETNATSLNDIMLDVNDLLLRAKNSTLDSDAMSGIVIELKALKEQALSALNKQSDGVYLFSGTDVYSPAIQTSPPYAFLGNDKQNQTKVDGEQTLIESNFTAIGLLAGDNSFFGALDDAIAEMQNPSGAFQSVLGSAMDATSKTQKDVMNTVSEIGAKYNALDRFMENSIDTLLYATTVQTNINELDYAEASVRLEQSMTTLRAAQGTFMKVMNNTNLFDLM